MCSFTGKSNNIPESDPSSNAFEMTVLENIPELDSSGKAFEITSNESSCVSYLIINSLSTTTSSM